MNAQDVASRIRKYKYNFSNEKELQAGINLALSGCDENFVRESPLGEAGIIDFFFLGGIGVEVKIKGSKMSVMRQLARYAKRPEIAALILVTTRNQLRAMPPELNEKEITVVYIGGL